MRVFLILVSFLSFQFGLLGQAISCSPENRDAVQAKIEEINKLHVNGQGDNLIAIGKTFLGTPYVAKTLELGKDEFLVINLQGLDCTTFVENVLALGLLQKGPDTSFDSFVSNLERIRYREGTLNGYNSRLHYFSEWIADNEAKGLVQDITQSLGGVEISKDLNFMTQHRSLYPALADEEIFHDLSVTEETIGKNPICILSLEMLVKNEALLANGDIVALATSIEGLDVTHTGFAIRMPDNRIHLLHASSSGAVEISDQPLVEYLKKIRNNTGIIVARPVY